MTAAKSIRRIAVAAMVVVALALGGCGLTKGKTKSTPTVGNRIPILSRIEAGTKVDTGMAVLDVVLPVAEPNPDWEQAGGSASKSYGHLALGAAPRKVWSVRIAGSSPKQRLAAAPVVGGGRLYVMDTEGMVRAFDATSGREVWKAAFRLPESTASVFGGGAGFNDGKVFITTGLGEVAAVDAASGKLLWRVKPAGPLRGSPTIAYGAVYVMTQDNQIIALNIADGAQLWSESGSVAQTGVFGVAAAAAGQGTIVAGYSSGELVAYRYENGRQLWSDALARTSIATSVSTLTDIDADPIIERGRVYALGQGGRMAAYELVTGQRVWELNLAGISTPAIAGDWIFTLTDEAKLLCIAKTTGKVRWIAQMKPYRSVKKKKGPIFWTGPVLAGDKLWMANSEGEIFAAAVADGAVKRYAKLGAPVTLAPIVAGGTLYVLDDSGHVTAMR
ncbi:MAG: PQQ-binding-like beta-propeller repeat protein [Novosphingobium sp.]|uniref:outer membrane protein assembly factor BamB family protein n=1 Tax=Novosphingobium sp. TaxID=1874826 RepID=UPI0030175004